MAARARWRVGAQPGSSRRRPGTRRRGSPDLVGDVGGESRGRRRAGGGVGGKEKRTRGGGGGGRRGFGGIGGGRNFGSLAALVKFSPRLTKFRRTALPL